jgi:hypothetical protein
LFCGTEPTGDKCQKLPLECVNPEHDKLGDAIEEVLANIAACSESWAKAGWLHSLIRMRDDSQNEIS